MIISNDKADQRLHNPMNLMNRMGELRRDKKPNAMSLFGVARSSQPSQVESATTQLSPSLTINPFERHQEISSVPSSQSPHPSFQATQATQTKETPSLDDLLEDGDTKIKLGHAHDQALETLTEAVMQLRMKLDDVPAAKLPAVITATSKVVESIRKERIEINKNNKEGSTVYNFYVPIQRRTEDFEVINV